MSRVAAAAARVGLEAASAPAIVGRELSKRGTGAAETWFEQRARQRAELHLIDFIKMMWEVLEPSRPFVDGWAVRAICDHLEAVSDGKIRKLLINVPPGFMKSMTTNVFWPAWEWGPRGLPSMRYIGASYAEQLTVRDNRRCRMLIQSELYQHFWGDRFRFVEDQNAKVRYDNDKTGFKIATSVGGMGTGERGDRFIVDDPHNVKEGESEAKREEVLQWFTEVVPTRVNDADKSVFIVIMQRVHDRDVSGLILANNLGYEHLCIPMEHEKDHPHPAKTSLGFKDPRIEDNELAWPERFSRNYLESDLKPSLRAWGGTYAESGQLQQRPVPRGGGMFKEADWQYVDVAPERVRCRVRGWDLAATDNAGAYTAGVKMSLGWDDKLYIEGVKRGQWSSKVVEDEMKDCANRDGKQVVIDFPQDPGQSGKSQRSYLVGRLQGYIARSSPETGSKEDRAKPLAAQQESHNVYLVRGSWNEAFVAEAGMFPKGHYKDQIDAASRAHARILIEKLSTEDGAGLHLTSPATVIQGNAVGREDDDG